MTNSIRIFRVSKIFISSPRQKFSNDLWTHIRVSNENVLTLIGKRWKLLDYHKVMNAKTQPLGLYFKLGCLLTNCLTCLDQNQVGLYFDCDPPSLEEYFGEVV